MPDIIAFALVSTRRIGEICRITHSDVEWDHLEQREPGADLLGARHEAPDEEDGQRQVLHSVPEIAEIIKHLTAQARR